MSYQTIEYAPPPPTSPSWEARVQHGDTEITLTVYAGAHGEALAASTTVTAALVGLVERLRPT